MSNISVPNGKSQEITIITSQDGIWKEEKLSFAQEHAYSPWQWKRMFKEQVSSAYHSSMQELKKVDNIINTFASELNYLLKLLPSDPTKLADIALIIIEIKQRIDSIIEVGQHVTSPSADKIKEFCGRFNIKIPKHLRTAETDSDEKIATAGILGSFVRQVGKVLHHLTDTDIREMKISVKHLLNITRQTVKSINQTLKDMRSARKTGDIERYIQDVQFISQEQLDFKDEFSTIYDTYLKGAYEYAVDKELEAKQRAEERGERFVPKREEVSIDDRGNLDVIEVNLPPEESPAISEEQPEVNALPPTVMQQPELSQKKPHYITPSALQRLPLYETPNYSEIPPTPQTPVTKDTDWEQVYKKELGLDEEYSKQRQLLENLGPQGRGSEPVLQQFQGGEPSSQFELTPPSEPDTTRWYERTMRSPVFEVNPNKQQPSPEVEVQMSQPDPETVRHTMRGPAQPIKEYTHTPTMRGPIQRERFEVGLSGQPPSSSELNIAPSQQEVNINPIHEYSSKIEEALIRVSHTRFLNKLNKIATTENQYIVAAFIAKYSEKLENINPYASAALLKVAQEISK